MSDRAEVLAEALSERLDFAADSIKPKPDQNEVYVNVDSYAEQSLAGMDDVCVVAHDHGFVPQGIIDSGAVRLKPRTDDDVSRTLD